MYKVLANARRLGYRIESAPVTLDFQRLTGRITWNDIYNLLCDTLAIFYRMKILKYYDRVPESTLDRLPVTEQALELTEMPPIGILTPTEISAG